MSNFSGNYLRVLTPKTIDGNVPKTGPDGRVLYKESHLPMSALKHLERKNLKRPNHLKHVINVVDVTSINEIETVPVPAEAKNKGGRPRKAPLTADDIEDV